MEPGRGLPLLSGPAPHPDSSTNESACRKCNKEFNVIFARSKRCNHCGYLFCSSCADYQALMPRTGPETGYDGMNVCAYCIEYLTITAAGRAALKAMPMSKLKNYINVYNIKTDRVVEKDDLIDAILGARTPTGCLPRANEMYYRKYSVPNKSTPNRSRGLFSSSRQGQSSNASRPHPPPPVPQRPSQPEFARPDLAPDNPQSQTPPHNLYPPPPPPPRNPPQQPQAPRTSAPPRHPQQQPQQQQQQQYAPPPHPPPRPHSAYGYTPPHQPPPQFPSPQGPYNQGYGYGYNPGYNAGYNPTYPTYNPNGSPPAPPQHNRPPPQGPPPQNYHNRPPQQQQQPRPSPGPPPAPPPRPRAASTAPPPSLNQLLDMNPESIGSLSISALKSVLFTNHVNSGQILEKGDLVKKVLTLVEDEKRERERQRRAEEMEEMERVQRAIEESEEREREAAAAAASVRADDDSQRIQDAPRVVVEDEATRLREEDGDGHTDVHNQSERNSGPSRSNTPAPPPPPKPATTPPKPKMPVSTMDRGGLCVVCQDEEANIAIVDCGHLAMCRGCSDLIMSSSRECPLCRTRIVTDARLLRIFKT